MAPTIPTQEDLVEREFELTESAKTLGLNPFFAICKDREERYREFLAAMSVPEELEAWVGQMKHRYTKRFEVPVEEQPTGYDDDTDEYVELPPVEMTEVDIVPELCLVWHNPIPLPWLVGLLVLLYGEHEYFWPTAFGEAEIRRAEKWLDGFKPPRRNEVKPCYVLPKGGE